MITALFIYMELRIQSCSMVEAATRLLKDAWEETSASGKTTMRLLPKQLIEAELEVCLKLLQMNILTPVQIWKPQKKSWTSTPLLESKIIQSWEKLTWNKPTTKSTGITTLNALIRGCCKVRIQDISRRWVSTSLIQSRYRYHQRLRILSQSRSRSGTL